MSEEIYLSVVIPAYNEAGRILDGLDDTLAYLRDLGRPSEILVVDDGSRDRTVELVKGHPTGPVPLRVVALETNQGKGEAVRRGMLVARGRYRLFRDADTSTRMAEFDAMRPLLEAGAPVVIASRRVASAVFEKEQPWLRKTLGTAFTLICRAMLVWEVVDYTCGFKAFEAKAADAVFSRQRIRRWGFDGEILFLAERLGFRIVQIPVKWKDTPGSKVNLAVDIWRTLGEMAQVRYNALTGAYRLPS